MENMKERVKNWAERVGWDVAAHKIQEVTYYGESAAMKIACGHYRSKLHKSSIEPLRKLMRTKMGAEERCRLRDELREAREDLRFR